MSLSEKLKGIIKKPATFGTNPLDPWSAKAGLAEDASLTTYLKSRGINPEFVSTQQKISHAKSTAYLRWKQQHMQEGITTDPGITHKKRDIIKQATHTHKEIKTPHGPGSHHEEKGSQVTQLTPESVSHEVHNEAKKQKPTALEKFRKASTEREKKHAEIAKKSGGMTAAIDRLEKHVNKEEVSQKEIDKFHKKLDKLVHSSFGKSSTEKKMKEETVEEDLRQWFKQKWVRMDTKGNIKGQCAREKGEGKPKCLPQAKAHALGKEKRAAAAQRKRREDPNPERKGKAINVKTEELDLDYISQEDINEAMMLEKNKPTQPEKWARAKAAAKSKFSVYPSAYANAWAAKKYKSMGGGWRSTKEELELDEVEQIDELKKSTVKSWLSQQPVVPARKPGMDKKAHNKRIKSRSKSWDSAIDRLTGAKPTSEDVGDPKAAVNADGLPNPQLEPVSEKKKQMSKSARIIKAMYKKKGMVREDLYDHEKEDKSVATYGKKPKMDTADKKESIGEKKPQAAATLSGGTTLTGSERDTVEIDPMMRNRPGQPDVTKKDDKKDDKKEDKKKDK